MRQGRFLPEFCGTSCSKPYHCPLERSQPAGGNSSKYRIAVTGCQQKSPFQLELGAIADFGRSQQWSIPGGWGSGRSAHSLGAVAPPEPRPATSMHILKEKSFFEVFTRQQQAHIVKFAICRHSPCWSTQNLRLKIELREKTQRNRKQKARNRLNRNCSLCIGTSIAYQLPCSQPV